ncbi:MFS transporter [Kribbella deserti]|uniref:MFS transporter n=1 Tax=Kribbella deserti TaxID=1926257 RepID=A0ABV6QVX6_9ACTN
MNEKLFSPQLVRLLVAVLGSGLSMYLLTSVVPLYLATNGASGLGAGLSTGAMMLSAVAVELAVPRMLARFGYRDTLALGLILLGLPALALPLSTDLVPVLIVCLIRGAGLAILVVGAVALIAEVAPAHRRGEALGTYGVVVGVPAVAALPLGVFLVDRIGFTGVFVLAAVTALASLTMIPGLPTAKASAGDQHTNVLKGLRGSGLPRPALVFAAVTVAAGVGVTFVPLAVADGNHSVVAAALLIQAAAAPVARWLAGRYGDRHGANRLLLPSVLLATLGAGSLVFMSNTAVLFVGMLLFGLGFGAAQNVTLSIMYDRVPVHRYGQVSALWNLAYDAGWGVGAIAFGLVVAGTGYPVAFALTTLVLAIALAFCVRVPAGPVGHSGGGDQVLGHLMNPTDDCLAS